jgi:hypothetical protein
MNQANAIEDMVKTIKFMSEELQTIDEAQRPNISNLINSMMNTMKLMEPVIRQYNVNVSAKR